MVSEVRASNKWLLGPNLDFWLIHGGCGVMFLPLIFLAKHVPATYMIAVYVYAFLFSKPHMAATWVRIGDKECRKQLPLLGWIAPIAIGLCLYLTVISWKLLGFTNLALFFASLLHQSMQNFGIMRVYLFKSHLATQSAVSRFAALAIQVTPGASVLCFLYKHMPSSFFALPLSLPPKQFIGLFAWVLVWISAGALISYSYLEYKSWRAGQGCLGRIFAVLGGCLVYIIGYQLIENINWGFIIASSWHCMQYLTYNLAFRKYPPIHAQLLNISTLQFLSLVVGLTAIIYLIQSGFILWTALVYPLASFTIGFHHYFADTFLWRRSRLNTIPGHLY